MEQKKNNSIIIGEIEFKGSLLESIIRPAPNISSLDKCIIEVRPNEGPVAHFHIVPAGKPWNVCVCIYSACYFNHNRETSKTLNTSQRKQLNDWLKSTNPKLPSKTNWEVIVDAWEQLYPDNDRIYPQYRNQRVSIQPDYTKMNTFRS